MNEFSNLSQLLR